MAPRVQPLRALALVAIAAFALHELRYVLAPGGHAAEPEHGYLAVAAPAVTVLLAIACCGFALTVARAREGDAPAGGAPRFMLLWAGASSALSVTYAVQEQLEGALAAPGAWLGFVLAVVLGALVALLLRGAEAVVASAARRVARTRPRPARSWPLLTRLRVSLDPVASNLAGRGPPFGLLSR